MNTKNPFVVAIAAGAAVAVLAYVLKQYGKAAAEAAGGVVSGNNAITRGTPYAGAGVAGTVGAATNAASGGVLQRAGESLGGWLYGVFGDTYDPNAKTPPFVRQPQILRQTDASSLWGTYGTVTRRVQ